MRKVLTDITIAPGRVQQTNKNKSNAPRHTHPIVGVRYHLRSDHWGMLTT